MLWKELGYFFFCWLFGCSCFYAFLKYHSTYSHMVCRYASSHGTRAIYTYFAIDISFEYIRCHSWISIPYPYSVIWWTGDEGLWWKHLSYTIHHLRVEFYTPDARGMVEEWPMFTYLLHIMDIPYIDTMIIVYTCHLKEKKKSWAFVKWDTSQQST